MQNDNEQLVRPFARIMADEVSQDEVESFSRKGVFFTVRSGPFYNDAPDIGVSF